MNKEGKLYAPTGAGIIATSDFVPGNALFSTVILEPDGTYIPDYDGETEMCWDGQYTDELDGRPTYVDDNGEQWPESFLIFVPDGSPLPPFDPDYKRPEAEEPKATTVEETLKECAARLAQAGLILQNLYKEGDPEWIVMRMCFFARDRANITVDRLGQKPEWS